MAVGQALVVEAREVQHRRVPVVDVHHAVDGGVADFIRAAVAQAALHAAAGHPHREALGVVVAAVAVLRVRRAAELAAPEDERVVEHPALLEVGKQCRDRLVDLAALLRELLAQVAVRVPAAVAHLDEAHALLGEAPRQQALARERVGRLLADAVHVERRLLLVGKIDEIRHLRLHAEREFVALDHAFELAVLLLALQALLVEPLDEVDLLALRLRAVAVVVDVRDRV